MQYPSGAWPWFKGMRENRYITQHIVSGVGHLKHLGVNLNEGRLNIDYSAELAIQYLDGELKSDYDRLKASGIKPKLNYLSSMQIHYLYARSFFPNVQIQQINQEAIDFYMKEAKEHWLDNSIYLQGMIGLIMHRSGDDDISVQILKSLNEKAIHHEELGMYWKANGGYYWYNAPIERQALMIELYSEVAKDTRSVDELKIWLLKNKQTNDWKTTKATSEACYALLLEGTDWLSETSMVTFKLGEEKFSSADVKSEAGTGYFKKAWLKESVKASMGNIEIKRQNTGNDKSTGISWGAVYWQYFEDLDKIGSHETPLKLSKELFIKRNTETGPKLFKISGDDQIKIGDLITVRIELRTDRDMEYVHMKDMRASGFEPVNVMSGYRYQDGLGYYESTKDASTNFFFDYLRKGVYVFEYDLRGNISGQFSNGISTIQSMYAPEFNSHSEGISVNITP